MASTIDYPNVISTVLFVGKCNWNCDFCYNRNLVNKDDIDFDKNILPKLLKRKKFINHIIISGGEISCYHKEAIILIKKLISYGFIVGIHSNGSNSSFIKECIECGIKFIGMDIKADTYINYKKITQTDFNFEQYQEIRKSIELIVQSGIEYDFRTTVYPKFLNAYNCISMAKQLSKLNAKHYVLQQFSDKEINCKCKSYQKKYLENIVNECNKYIKTELRGY